MSGVIRIALVDPNDASRETLKALLLDMDLVWLEAECSRPEFFLDMVRQSRPDIAVVAIEPAPEQSIQLIQDVTTQCAPCNVLVVSDTTDGQLILAAMRAGAKEFLQRPIDQGELIQAIQRLGSNGSGREGGGEEGGSKVVTVIGATGGVGATAVAVNLGTTMARDQGRSVALLDLDLALGDADVCLDLLPDYTLADVSANIERLDLTLLKRSLAKHGSGLFLLARPSQLESVADVGAEQVRRVIGLLKASFNTLLIDTSKGFLPTDLVAMDMADDILLVTQLDLPCLRNVVRILMALTQANGLVEKVKVVLNRLGLEDGEISLKKAEETIGREIYWQIPNDWRSVAASRNNGVPLITHAPRSKVHQAIEALGARLHGRELDIAGKRRGLFSFLS